MVKVKINDIEYDSSVTPVIVTVDKTFSRDIGKFFVNGEEYNIYVSKQGKLVVNKPTK
jgi:hypothetical protein